MRCEDVPDPRIEHPRDADIKVTTRAFCGFDLHFCNDVIPLMHTGDVIDWMNTLQPAIANITSASLLAGQNKKQQAQGSGNH